jgi:hypothetical protein
MRWPAAAEPLSPGGPRRARAGPVVRSVLHVAKLHEAQDRSFVAWMRAIPLGNLGSEIPLQTRTGPQESEVATSRRKVVFTIRSLMIAVALLGLNLGGAIATWKRIPAPHQPSPLINGGPWDTRHGVVNPKIRIDLGELETGERLVRVERRSPPPTLAEVWSPVVASVSITLLVLLVPLVPPTALHARTLTMFGGGPPPIRSHAWLAARRLTILAGLIGLNVAGAVYRPLPDARKQPPSPVQFFDSDTFLDEEGNFLHNHLDESLEIIRTNGAPRPPTLDDCRAPLQDGDARGRFRDTSVKKTLGSIVAYEIRPGLMGLVLTRPRRIKSWVRSFLDEWSLALASALTTVVALLLSWRHTGWHGTEPVAGIVERIDNTFDCPVDSGLP